MLFFKAPLHCLRKNKAFRLLLNSQLNKPRFFETGLNHKIALRPLIHTSIWLRRKKHEPVIRKLISKISKELNQSKKNTWFFDVGANVGLYTWEVANICPNLKVMSFEPDPDNFELLKMTHSQSGSKNIKLCSYALSDRSAEAVFNQDKLTSATGSLSSEEKPWTEKYLNVSTKKIKVQTNILDTVVENDQVPALIKIDVEGHEKEVIDGGKKTIEKFKPTMILESFPPIQQKIIQTLDRIGYKIYDADRLSPVVGATQNLFAWHPKGPLKESFFNNLLRS